MSEQLAAATGGDGGGDPPDLEHLFISHAPAVRWLAVKQGVPQPDLDDVVTEVFLRYAAAADGTDVRDVGAFILALTSHVCREHMFQRNAALPEQAAT